MPTFYQDDFDIDVNEFLDSCDSSEINEVISYLQESGHLTSGVSGYITTTNGGLNPLEHEWEKLTSFISEIRLRMSNEDEEALRTIAKKYGYY
jgi:hypothetical protein